MGTKQLRINGQTRELDEDTTAAELKEQFGASPNDIVTYRYPGDESMGAISNRDTLDAVPEGARMAFQPGGTVYGARR